MDRATSNSIDIYRNNVLIVRVPNNRCYADHPNCRGHATYIYKYARRAQVTALIKLL
jgi:hypothetical protein